MEKKYSISDASRQVEVENHVLRYWEEELGLNIHRNSKGHRFYTDRDIKILRDVKDLKEQGFLLKSIKLIINDIDNVRKMNPNEQYKLREELNQKIQDEEENKSNKNANVSNVVVSMNHGAAGNRMIQFEQHGMAENTISTEINGQLENVVQSGLSQRNIQGGENQSSEMQLAKTKNFEAQQVGGRNTALSSEEKVRKFELLLRKMITNVVEEGQIESEKRISENVSEKLMKEINYIMMQKDETALKQTKLLEEILEKVQGQPLEEVAATSQLKQIKTKEKARENKKNRQKEKNKAKKGLRIFG